MKFVKLLLVSFACITLVTCGGGNGGTNNNINETPQVLNISGSLNIGNISTIPIGHGSGTTFVVVSNNFPDSLIFTSGTYTTYDTNGNANTNDVAGANSPTNVNWCKTIQANSTCSVIISIPSVTSGDGQYLLTLTFKNTKTNVLYSASQIISYSSNVATSPTGIIFSSINNTIYNQPGSSTTYSIPFVLTSTISGFTPTSEYNNPAFAPAISCSGVSPYPAGTLCTLYIRVSGTGTNSLISGNVIVNNNSLSSGAQVKSKQISIKGTSGYLFNVPVTVVQNNTGNIVTSGINTIINPANGTAPKTITLLNNGAGTVSGINVIPANPLTIASNGCSSLTPGNSCTFNVNTTQTSNGQSSVTINYTAGSNTKSLAFNIAYIAAAPTPGLILSTSGTFVNTTINSTTKTININVLNNSNAQLNNITFNSANFPAGMSYSSGSSSCLTNGFESLSANQSCTLVVQYAPTVTVSSNTFPIRATAQYLAPDSTVGSISSTGVSINYSATAGNAFVYITPNNVSFAIRADGTDSLSQTFTLVNTSTSLTAPINSESNSSPPVTAYPGTVGGTCGTFPHTLGVVGSGTESCTVITTFGPTVATISTTSQMIANYTANTGTGESASTYSFLTFTASPAALIKVNSITVSGQSSGNGNASPYQFTNSPSNVIQFIVNYINNGTQNATNFNVALNNLPMGYYVVESLSTCGRESTTTTLTVSGASESCNVVFAAMSPTESYNPYLYSGPLNVNIPGYSYTDVTTGTNVTSAPLFSPTYTSNTINVNANLFGTATESTPPNWTTATAGGTNTLTFTSATNGLRVTIPNSGQLTVFTFPTTTNSCVIASGTCTINVQNPAGFPIGTVFFQYVVSPIGSVSGATGIINTGSFTYTS